MVAYRRTSGRCQRCFEPFAADQVVVIVREKLIAEEFIDGTCTHTTEWVAVCANCATPKEQAAATHEALCQGCTQPMLIPPGRAYTAVCSARCAQRRRRREISRRRGLIACRNCGTTFLPKRNDAGYCSPACRQKAYRGRIKATAP